MNNEPIVSVLITAYNREKFIGEAIESVLASSYSSFELIIVDDSSSDNTFEVAKSYTLEDSRIHLYRNTTNLGQFANRNRAASLAKGEFLKYLDSDDILYPNALEHFVNSLKKYPTAVIGIACHNNISCQPNSLFLISGKDALFSHYLKGDKFLYTGPSGTIFKKKTFDSLGGFKTSGGILNDTLLMLMLTEEGDVAIINRDLFHWRIHENQITVGQKNEFNMIIERHAINREVLFNDNSNLDEITRMRIWKKMKIIYVRNIFIKFFLKGYFMLGINLLVLGKITFKDILRSFTFSRNI